MSDSSSRSQEERALPLRWGMGGPVVTGWIVLAVLMVLVVAEFIIAIYMDRNLPIMVVMNVIDAALIMYYFMHVTRLWRGREED